MGYGNRESDIFSLILCYEEMYFFTSDMPTGSQSLRACSLSRLSPYAQTGEAGGFHASMMSPASPVCAHVSLLRAKRAPAFAEALCIILTYSVCFSSELLPWSRCACPYLLYAQIPQMPGTELRMRSPRALRNACPLHRCRQASP